MMYRAKVTNILSEIKEHPEWKKYNLVKDKYDTWIEVPDEKQADYLEAQNTQVWNP